MITRRLGFLSAIVLAGACRSAPARGPEPLPPVSGVPNQRPIEPSTTTQRWTITPSQETHRYSSTINTSIELNQPTGITRDSVVSTVTFLLQTRRAAQIVSYSATVESMSSRGGSRIDQSMSLSLPFTFSGRLDGAKITADSTSIECSSEALAAVPIVQRSLVLVPIALETNLTWTDSVTSAVCSGGVPATVTTARSYRILGESAQGILIERRDRTTTIGEGSQGQHRIKLRAEGSGTTQLVIDPGTGTLVQSAGTSTTTVMITASGRDQRFVQTVNDRTVRSPN